MTDEDKPPKVVDLERHEYTYEGRHEPILGDGFKPFVQYFIPMIILAAIIGPIIHYIVSSILHPLFH